MRHATLNVLCDRRAKNSARACVLGSPESRGCLSDTKNRKQISGCLETTLYNWFYFNNMLTRNSCTVA